MSNDWLIYALCILLMFVGGLIGHALAVSELGLFDFVVVGDSGWIQFSLGLLVSFGVYKLSGAQAKKHEAGIDRVLRHQELKGQGVDVGVVRNERGETMGLSQSTMITDSITVSCSVVGIHMERVVLADEVPDHNEKRITTC